MTNNRRKGKRIELEVAEQLRPLFPDIRRNLLQTLRGGCDYVGTPGFSIEVKGGKKYKSAMLRAIIDQLEAEATPDTIRLAVVKPDREQPYCVLPLEDFVILLSGRNT